MHELHRPLCATLLALGIAADVRAQSPDGSAPQAKTPEKTPAEAHSSIDRDILRQEFGAFTRPGLTHAGLTSAEEAALPVFDLPWPRGLTHAQFNHVVIAARTSAFACASRLSELTEQQGKARATKKRLALATTILAAGTAATTSSMQFVKNEGHKSNATAAVGIIGGLVTTVLGAITVAKNGETVEATAGKRIGEIQTAITEFAQTWNEILEEAREAEREQKQESPEATVSQPQRKESPTSAQQQSTTGAGTPEQGGQEKVSRCQPTDAGTEEDSEENDLLLVVPALNVDPDVQCPSERGVCWRWWSVPHEKYFRQHHVNESGSAIVPCDQREHVYLALMNAVSDLTTKCVSRVDLEAATK